MSGPFPVSFAFSIVPEPSTATGMTQSQTPEMPSVNWYGGEMPTHGKSSSVSEMPRFDGLMKCRVPPPGTGARSTNFDPIATAVAKTIGSRRAFG